jgi:hypothetical protein
MWWLYEKTMINLPFTDPEVYNNILQNKQVNLTKIILFYKYYITYKIPILFNRIHIAKNAQIKNNKNIIYAYLDIVKHAY